MNQNIQSREESTNFVEQSGIRQKAAELYQPLVLIINSNNDIQNKKNNAWEIIDKSLSTNEEEKIFACIIKSLLEKLFAAKEAHPQILEKLRFVTNGKYKITYNIIHNTNQLVLYKHPEFGDFIDLKDTYLFYLTLRDILSKKAGNDGILIADTMIRFFCDLDWMRNFISLFKELNINPFENMSIAEIGGRDVDCNNQNPVILFLSTFFKSYKNISADQEAKTSVKHENFVNMNNYRHFFGEQKIDYIWTANVLSYFVIKEPEEISDPLISDLFKICSIVTKLGGKIFHLTGYDDFRPEMRPKCLSDKLFHAECGVVAMPTPMPKDNSLLRVNIFSKI